MKIEGIVVRGRQLGRTLGFPTANLQPERIEGDGPDGVYAAWFELDGARIPCMLNIAAIPRCPAAGEAWRRTSFASAATSTEGARRWRRSRICAGSRAFPPREALRAQLVRDAALSLSLLEDRPADQVTRRDGRFRRRSAWLRPAMFSQFDLWRIPMRRALPARALFCARAPHFPPSAAPARMKPSIAARTAHHSSAFRCRLRLLTAKQPLS